ncbi:Putative HTH-type transcriptional regulator [bacterium HR11]|nr:Putative HTH-type transcriptional regulator [bacterium HR11]
MRAVQDVLLSPLDMDPGVLDRLIRHLTDAGYDLTYVGILHTNPAHDEVRGALERLQTLIEDYRHRRPSLRFECIPIRDGSHYPIDLETERDSQLFLRVLYQAVVAQKRRHRRVHLSIASGRRFMAAYAMIVAQLLFDDEDRVWRVVYRTPQSGRPVIVRTPVGSVRRFQTEVVSVPVLRWALLPSTLHEILVWDDPLRAIERQRALQASQQKQWLRQFYRSLSPAERQVLRLLAEGLSNKEIACRLRRRPKTVKNQIASIYRKYRAWIGDAGAGSIRTRLLLDVQAMRAEGLLEEAG